MVMNISLMRNARLRTSGSKKRQIIFVCYLMKKEFLHIVELVILLVVQRDAA